MKPCVVKPYLKADRWDNLAWGLICGLLFLTPSPFARAESAPTGKAARIRVNRELTWSMLENLITIGETQVAQAVLAEHLRVDPQDGRSWIFLGQVQLRNGETGNAKASLKKARELVAFNEPRMLAYAEAELKLATGKTQDGEKLMKRLANQPGEIGKKARKALAALEAGKGERSPASIVGIPALIEPRKVSKAEISKPEDPSIPWKGSANLSLLTGYDANILQIADSLAPAAANLGSPLSTLGLQGVLSGGGLGGTLSISGAAAYTRNFSELAAGLNNFSLSSGIQWAPRPNAQSRVAATLSLGASTVLMESAGYGFYTLSYSAQPTLIVRMSDQWVWEVSGSGAVNQFPGAEVATSSDDRTGPQAGVSTAARGTLGAWSLSTSIAHTRQFATGANFRTQANSLSATVSHPLPFLNSSFNSLIGFSQVNYPQSDTSRSDQLTSGSLTWEVPVKLGTDTLRTQTSLGWSQSASSDEVADFSKYVLNFQVIYGL